MTFRNTVRPALLAALVPLLAAWAAGARAEYRAPYFDKARPEITFDAKNLKWTLYNRAVARVVYFDKGTGGLRTTLLRDLKRKRDFAPAPNSEGTFTFAAALKEPPAPLTGWKSVEAEPGTDWIKPDFSDAAWKPAALPAPAATGTRWYRAALPGGRLASERTYALLVYAPAGSAVEVWVDGAQVLAAPASDRLRLHQADLPAASRAVAVKSAGGLGYVAIAEAGSAPQTIGLGGGWKYMTHALNAGPDGSKILTVSLSGLKLNEGFDVDVNYQVFPGEEPTMAKWFGFLSHRQTRFLIESVTYDRWSAPSGAGEAQGDALCKTFYAPGSRAGLMAGLLSPLGAVEAGTGAEAGTLAPVLRPYALVKPDDKMLTPPALLAAFEGGPQTGLFLYQLHVGQYAARATETSVPNRYSTAFFRDAITADLCARLIPAAKELDLTLFVMGDGWQGGGKYGDWNSDRTRFPQGLLPVSAQARAEKLRFGIFADPARVSADSGTAREHPDWRVQTLDGVSTERMCFTGGWASDFTQSMTLLCRELGATALHLGDSPLTPGCIAPGHEHPVAHSRPTQMEYWTALTERLRGLTQDFVVAAPIGAGAELLRWNDADAAPASAPASALSSAPTPAGLPDAYSLSDAFRDARRASSHKLPPFVTEGTAFARVRAGAEPGSLDALEYHLSSVCALSGSVELQGDLTALSVAERQTILKWLNWQQANRALLAYGQPLDLADAPGVDGVVRLRPALNGRHGFVCLWNRGTAPQQAALTLDPRDWFVSASGRVQAVRFKDGTPADLKIENGKLSLAVSVAPRSWEIYEIRERQ